MVSLKANTKNATPTPERVVTTGLRASRRRDGNAMANATKLAGMRLAEAKVILAHRSPAARASAHSCARTAAVS
jgi:hypothetical protein